MEKRKRGRKDKKLVLFRKLKKIESEVFNDGFTYLVSLLRYPNHRSFQYGTLEHIYKKRNEGSFKNFFFDKKLYQLVKKEIEILYPKYKRIRIIITRYGIMVCDNYRPNNFNVLLLTIHAGRWAPENIEKKMRLTRTGRFREEDIDSDRIYSNIVLERGGIWINSKLSRYVCDLNRPQNRCIYFKKDEKWIDNDIWDDDLTNKEITQINRWHQDFYVTLHKVLETYKFNIIFDGHTMKDRPGRPTISFGTKHISPFYMPVVRAMKNRLKKVGYKDTFFNRPYGGGFILKWLKTKFQDKFIFSMEINKKEYMNKDRTKTKKDKVERLSHEITQIFDIK